MSDNVRRIRLGDTRYRLKPLTREQKLLEFCDSKNSSGSSAEPQPKPDDSFMSIPDGIDEELPFN